MGLMGSLHCIGMCGALVFSIHSQGSNGKSRWDYLLSYYIGKTSTYIFLGILFGSLGQTFHLFLSQQKLSIIVGVSFLIYFGVSRFNPKYLAINIHSNLLNLTRLFSQLIQKKSNLKLFLMGAGNGFLPCGLVYTAAIASISTGHVINSVFFMLGFGIGTIPSLTSVVYIFKFIPEKLKPFLNYMYQYLILLIAILLILRGMNLGIPYISPAYNEHKEEVHSCCHK